MNQKQRKNDVKVESPRELNQYMNGLLNRVDNDEIDAKKFMLLDRVCRHMIRLNTDDVKDRATFLKAKEKGISLAGHASAFKRAS